MTFEEAIADPIAYIGYLTDNIRDGIMRLPDWGCPVDPFHDGVEEVAVREGTQYRDAAALHTVSLLSDLRKIAPHWEALQDDPQCAETLLDAQRLAVWKQYLRPFETEDIDCSLVYDIDYRYETNEPVSEEEAELHERYCRLVRADAARRLGKDKPYAYEEIIHAMRYCALVSLNAPKVIINAEAYLLAQHVLLNWCAKR